MQISPKDLEESALEWHDDFVHGCRNLYEHRNPNIAPSARSSECRIARDAPMSSFIIQPIAFKTVRRQTPSLSEKPP
jgi:hypothetical protein